MFKPPSLKAKTPTFRPVSIDFTFPLKSECHHDSIRCVYDGDINVKSIHTIMRSKLAGRREDWSLYVEENKGLIEEYLVLAPPSVKGLLGSDTDENIALRLPIIERYLNNIIQFIQVYETYPQAEYIPCSVCKMSPRDMETGEGDLRVCECGNLFSFGSIRRDDSSPDDSPNKMKRVTDSFEQRLIAYQGRQMCKIGDDTLGKLEVELRSQGLKPSEFYRSLPTDAFGKKEGTSVSALRQALKKIEFSSHYKDVELIGKIMWGWELDDLSDVIVQVMENYAACEKIYSLISGSPKSMSGDVLIYWHLRAVGRQIRPEDVTLPVTEKSRTTHNEIIREISSRIGIPSVSI